MLCLVTVGENVVLADLVKIHMSHGAASIALALASFADAGLAGIGHSGLLPLSLYIRLSNLRAARRLQGNNSWRAWFAAKSRTLEDQMSTSQTTTSHKKIQALIEARNGHPARVTD